MTADGTWAVQFFRVEHNMKIYIAGKITNNPNYKEQFNRKELELKLQGHTVINPTILSDILLTHDEYLHICKAMIDVCDAVYFLDNWQDSKGAVIEHAYAGEKGKRLMFEDEAIFKEME